VKLLTLLPILALLAAGCSDAPPRALDSMRDPATSATSTPAVDPQEISELTLEDALLLTSRAHPDLAEAVSLAEAAEGRAEQAGLWPNPEASLRMEAAPFGRRTWTDADYLLGLSQAIPVGGRLGAAQRAYHLEALKVAAEARARERALSKRVRSAYAEALFFESLANLRERSLDLAEAGVKTALARLSAGEATADETARAQLEAARANALLKAARSRREVALSSLSVAMGRPRVRLLSLKGELQAAMEIPVLEQLDARLQSHPALAAADADIAAREALQEVARSGRIPDLNLEAGYRYIGDGNTHAFDVGVSFALPVLDRNQGRLREANAEIAAARARARQTRASLEGDLRQALARLTAALDALRVAREVLAPAIAEMERVAEARFAAGDVSAGELATIRRERVASDVEILEALREATEAWGEVQAVVE
jgi:outer membrane protein, heavy metal efflux system